MARRKNEAEVVLTAKDEASKKIEKVNRKLGESGKAAEKASKSFGASAKSLIKYAAVTAAATVAITALVGVMKDGVKMAIEQEAINKKLTLSQARYGGEVEKNVKNIKRFAAAQQNLSIFSNEQIEVTAILLANMGVVPEKLEEATLAAINYARALDQDLSAATKLVGESLSGVAGRLKKTVKGMDNLSVSTLKAGGAIDLINARFGGQAASEMDTFAGKIALMTNNWDDLKKSLGEVITAAVFASGALEKANRALSIHAMGPLGGEFVGAAPGKGKQALGGKGGVFADLLALFLGAQTDKLPSDIEKAAKKAQKLAEEAKKTADEISKLPDPFEKARRESEAIAASLLKVLETTRKIRIEGAGIPLVPVGTKFVGIPSGIPTVDKIGDAGIAALEAFKPDGKVAKELDISMASLGISAGFALMQGIKAGIEGGTDMVMSTIKGILPLIGAILGGVIGGAAGGIGAAPGAALGGQIGGGLAGLLHTGSAGYAGQAHTGVGLRSDETFKVLKDEMVLNRQAVSALGGEGRVLAAQAGIGGGGGTVININAIDTQSIRDALRRGDLGKELVTAINNRRGQMRAAF